MIPRVVKEVYEVGKVKLLDELVYGDVELKAEADKAEIAILFENGKYVEILEMAEEMITVEENNASAWLLKGSALESLGRYDVALAAFSKSIELNPDNAAAWLIKGEVLMKLDKNEEALEAFSKSLELNKEVVDTWLRKGLALGKLR